MNRSMISRITKAKMYQKKAFQALLPENVAGHLEVIEQELTAMFMECTTQVLQQKRDACDGSNDNSQNPENRNGKSTKKVTID